MQKQEAEQIQEKIEGPWESVVVECQTNFEVIPGALRYFEVQRKAKGTLGACCG